MYRVIKICTDDGEMFNSEDDARHHIENNYNAAVSELALSIRGINNATKLKLVIDDNIDLLDRIVRLKEELTKGIEAYD